MELRALRSFLVVTDYSNINRASEHLHMSQPALSQTLQHLEREIGQALFHRTASGVELTDAGTLLRFHALRIIHAVEDAEEELGTGQSQDTQLSLGVLPTLTHDYVPGILRRLVDRVEKPPSIKLVESTTQGLVKHVLTGALDLAILDLPISEPSLDVAALWRERLVLVASRKFHLDPEVAWKDLAEYPFITTEPGYGLRDMLFQMALAHGFQPRIVFELTSFNTIIGFVRAGFGIALVPYRSVRWQVDHHLVHLVELVPRTHRDIGIIWRGSRHLPPNARRLKQLLTDFSCTPCPE